MKFQQQSITEMRRHENIFDGFSREMSSLAHSMAKLIKPSIFSRIFVLFDGFRHGFRSM